MASERYIQVILPLKLEWEPFYRLPDGMEVEVGSRVRVIFANAFYTACVSRVDVTPQMDPSRIMPVEAVEEALAPISAREIDFWRALAAYYLCSLGEVYKVACPSIYNRKSRLKLPDTGLPEVPELKPEEEAAVSALRTQTKTVLLNGTLTRNILLQRARETLEEGKSVLLLVPETGHEEEIPGAMLYNSQMTAGKKKAVAEKLRTGQPCMVVGTRSALFLPFQNLGLVIVDREHDPAYKQDAPAPRYNARESAIMLAGIHGAQVILSSPTPSLESLYNARCGRFASVESGNSPSAIPIEIIDIGAEYRKRGMAGAFSLKLLSLMKTTLEEGRQVLLLAPKRIYEQGRRVEDNVLEYFPSARVANLDLGPADDEYDIYIASTAATRGFSCRNLGMVALVSWDGMLSRQDFRADERAFQLLEQFRAMCPHLVIQTREPSHPVFRLVASGQSPVEHMLEERRDAAYPPYTRMVKVQVKDVLENRLLKMTRELSAALGEAGIRAEGPFAPGHDLPLREIHILLPRDKTLVEKKAALGKTVAAFEQSRKYTGHIVIDVDPV